MDYEYMVKLKPYHVMAIGHAVISGIFGFVSGMTAYDSNLNLLESAGKGAGWFLMVGGIWSLVFLGDHRIAARKRSKGGVAE